MPAGLPEEVPVEAAGPVADLPVAQGGPAFALDAVEDAERSLVAQAHAVGQDEPVGAELLAQTADMNSHRTRVQIFRIAPYIFQQLIALENMPRTAGQKPKQIKLGGC